jgi:hypothetical protein
MLFCAGHIVKRNRREIHQRLKGRIIKFSPNLTARQSQIELNKSFAYSLPNAQRITNDQSIKWMQCEREIAGLELSKPLRQKVLLQ